MPCPPAEPAEPAERAKLRGAKGVPASWHEPSQPWPKRGAPESEKGVRYHEDKKGVRKYWRCDDGKQRWPICVCTPDGLCGQTADGKTRPGYASACATREDRKARYEAAKQANGGALPPWKGIREHKGKEEFVIHRGKECTTWKSDGIARPLCKCGKCFKACQRLNHEYAIGCVHNTGAKCKIETCPGVAVLQGYCATCAKRVDATALRKAEREPELQALMAQHGIERAPDDANDPSVKAGVPYAQLNQQADWAARVVLKTSNGKGGFQWYPGCRGTFEPGKAPGPCPGGGVQTHALYDFHCVRCFIASYPNDVRAINAKRYLKAKELAVREFLDATFPAYKWVFDRAFAIGVKERPDALTRTRDRILIVEIDEDSHIIEPCGKEREREAIFQRRNKNAEIVMIRFNPDAYTDLVTGQKVPSCFHVSKKENLVKVHPNHKAAWAHRLGTLANAIRMCIDESHPDYLKFLPPKEEGRAFFSFELFYDNINGMTEAQQEAKRQGRIDGYKRAANILKKEDWHGAEGEIARTGEEDPLAIVDDPDLKAVVAAKMEQRHASELSYAAEPAEKALMDALANSEPAASRAIAAEDFSAAMAALAALRAPIDRFFEEVTVNADEENKRAHRLDLLARFRAAVHKVADFSRIEG